MPKEMFPQKKPGDGLSADHINKLGRVVANLSGGNQGSGLQGTHGWISGIASAFTGPLKLARVVDETSTAYVYNVLIRTWNEDSGAWTYEDDEYPLDARCFSKDDSAPQQGPVLVCKDLLQVRWDKGRDAYVPVQMLFQDSRWCWVDSAIAARDGADVSSQLCKLVVEVLNPAGTAIAWSYLLDDDGAEVQVRVFNGFPDEIPSGLHARIGWNSIGQYEIKGLPCASDEELDVESSASSNSSSESESVSSVSLSSLSSFSASSVSSQSQSSFSQSSLSSQSQSSKSSFSQSSASSPSSDNSQSSASSPSSQSASSASSQSSQSSASSQSSPSSDASSASSWSVSEHSSSSQSLQSTGMTPPPE